MTLDELTDYAELYAVNPYYYSISFNENHYTRTIIHKDIDLEIALCCFLPNQTNSMHNHQGTNCVIKVIEGKIAEQRFSDSGADVEFVGSHSLQKGDVSIISGFTYHQFCNDGKEPAVLLSFKSPGANFVQ